MFVVAGGVFYSERPPRGIEGYVECGRVRNLTVCERGVVRTRQEARHVSIEEGVNRGRRFVDPIGVNLGFVGVNLGGCF